MMNWIQHVFRNYATFEGRARRMEFWSFSLFCFVVLVVLSMLDRAMGTMNPAVGMGLLGGIFCLAVLVPSIAVTVRRLHDTDRSGLWYLLVLLPLIGGIVILVFMLLDSQPGANRFGPNPKGVMGTGTPAAA
jgi:uncharacterized membrane protein YhaH (DUF805 family)